MLEGGGGSQIVIMAEQQQLNLTIVVRREIEQVLKSNQSNKCMDVDVMLNCLFIEYTSSIHT